ncbi:MAG: antibiotic biosynthesis monooxygenase [Acidimicrobiaceae bacterium]|nr:antibiotic biosynthesis monooxygenase [Acidimicrobiaceae bacterium]MDE0499041.1 antibiotic biosynthesis monooxygenase [Acidimicrobiaceae bacterium]
MIRTVLALRPRAESADAVVKIFEDEQIIERALTVEGCLGVEVWAKPGEVLVMGTWASPSAYRAWLEHPQRNTNNDALNELLEVPLSAQSEGSSYTLALSGGPVTDDWS